jgi:hypothetical protein
METNCNKLVAFSGKSGKQTYYCESCHYTCFKKYNWDKHLLTLRHYNETKCNKCVTEKVAKVANKSVYSCENCNKDFNNRTSLWRHKQKCKKEEDDDPSDKELILKILKQNSELIKENSELRKEQTDIKELILEIVKNGTTNNSHNTHTNSHNKAFNLNFFLNETCKNAMNITDFVDSIKLQLNDLMDVGELGYVEGISKIIVNNLNNLDETVRPIHCTDKKRETMYVKDQGEWEKEDEKKSKLTKAVKNVADKNIKLLPLFREKFPDYKNYSSKTSDKYDKLVIEVMTTDDCKDEKIIKNISKVTTIKEKTI